LPNGSLERTGLIFSVIASTTAPAAQRWRSAANASNWLGVPRAGRALLELCRYFVFRRGMLASSGMEAFAFTQVHPGPVAAPDLEILFGPIDHRDEFLEPPKEHAFFLASAVVAPRSRGRLTLRSADALAPPVIDFGLLSDPDGIDASVLWEGVRLSRKIAATPPLALENAGELRPGASSITRRARAGWARTSGRWSIRSSTSAASKASGLPTRR
jgi:choline dehydrogenase-like flavoprotein